MCCSVKYMEKRPSLFLLRIIMGKHLYVENLTIFKYGLYQYVLGRFILYWCVYTGMYVQTSPTTIHFRHCGSSTPVLFSPYVFLVCVTFENAGKGFKMANFPLRGFLWETGIPAYKIVVTPEREHKRHATIQKRQL